jgi:hypothetical protein
MKLMICGGILASAFAVVLGTTNLLLNPSLSENESEITGSIKTAEPFAPVKPRTTDIILAGRSLLESDYGAKPTSSVLAIKLSIAKKASVQKSRSPESPSRNPATGLTVGRNVPVVAYGRQHSA